MRELKTFKDTTLGKYSINSYTESHDEPKKKSRRSSLYIAVNEHLSYITLLLLKEEELEFEANTRFDTGDA